MFHQRVTSKFLLLLAALMACLGLAACGDDDSDDAASGDVPSEDVAPAPDETDEADEAEGDSEGEGEGESDTGSEDSAGAGTATVDGVTYTFTPTLCLPDEANGSSVTGAGSAEDGTDVYVDLAAGNLSIYVGTDDPFSADPDYVASSVVGQGSLDETVDGSTVSIEASFTAHESMEVIADGSVQVTC